MATAKGPTLLPKATPMAVPLFRGEDLLVGQKPIKHSNSTSARDTRSLLETHNVSGNRRNSSDIAIMVPKLPKANTGYLYKGDAAVQPAAQKAGMATAPKTAATKHTSSKEGLHTFSNTNTYALSQPYKLEFPALGPTPSAPCSRLRGLRGTLETRNISKAHARYRAQGLKTPRSGSDTSSEGQKPSRLSPTMTICATSSAHEPTSLCKGHHTLLPYDVHTPTESHWPIQPPGLQPVHMRTTYALVLLTPAPSRQLKIHGHERCEGPI